MAGGVALNCVANSKIVNEGLFNKIWIQPAAGDAGGAIGAAYACFYIWGRQERRQLKNPDAMHGAYLGPEYDDKDILKVINKYGAVYTHFETFDD